MGSNIRWGIIGPGKIARKFAEALANTEGVELYAVASRNEEVAQNFAKEYNASQSYGSYQQLVEDNAVDIVYIATPHAFHKEHTLLCLNNNKPVLCEKPLAHKLSDVKEMIETAEAKNLFLMEAMWTRFLPPVNKALELIAEGQIGEVKLLEADFGFNTSYNAESRLYNKALGGGSLLDVGVYPLFLALTVLGEPIGFTCSAKLAPTGVDESFSASLNYPNAKAEIRSSLIESTKLEAVITGTEGSIRFASPWYRQTYLVMTNKHGSVKEIKFDYAGNGFEPQIIEAIKCLKNGTIESSLMPHRFSLLQSVLLDAFCKECGIVYP